MRRLLAAFLLVAAPAAAQTEPTSDYLEGRAAVLGGLDKVTARVIRFEVGTGETVRFGSLDITVRACRKRPPEEPPESAAFLEIDDARPNQETKRVYTGWMFASSPAVAALEHPVYDVWVINCRLETDPVTPPAPLPQPPAPRPAGTEPRSR